MAYLDLREWKAISRNILQDPLFPCSRHLLRTKKQSRQTGRSDTKNGKQKEKKFGIVFVIQRPQMSTFIRACRCLRSLTPMIKWLLFMRVSALRAPTKPHQSKISRSTIPRKSMKMSTGRCMRSTAMKVSPEWKQSIAMNFSG